MEYLRTYENLTDEENESVNSIMGDIKSSNNDKSCIITESDARVTRTKVVTCGRNDTLSEIPSSDTESVTDSQNIDYFSLQNDSSDNEIETASSRTDKHCPTGTQQQRSYAADGSFWQEDGAAEKLEGPTALWTECNPDTGPIDNNIENGQSTSTKRAKYNAKIVCQDEIKSTDSNMKLKKNCFYVHHRIAPRLSGVRQKVLIPRRCEVELPGHNGAVNRIKWCCPQYSHLLLSASMDKTIRVWNVFSPQKTCVQKLGHHERAVTDAKWSWDGRQIVSGGYDKTCRIVDVEQGVCVQSVCEDSYVTCVEYHPVDYNLVLAGSCNQVTVWDSRAAQKPVRTFRYKDVFGQVLDLEFVPNGKEFFTCNDLVSRDSADRNVMAWDFTQGIVVSNQMYQERYTCTRLRIDQAQLLAQTQGGYIAEFSTVRPYRLNKCRRYGGHQVSGYKVGFDVSADSGLVVSGNAEGRVPFYNRRTGAQVGQVDLGRGEVCLDVAWHQVLPSTVAMATWSGGLTVWG